jgi:hypothetical protein
MIGSETSRTMHHIEARKKSVVRVLTREHIHETLAIYEERFRCIRSAEWSGSKLQTEVELKAYPFTKPGIIDYMTGAMATLYVSQAAYIAARAFIEDGGVQEHPSINTQHFFKARDVGDLVISSLEFRFRRKISLNLERVDLNLNLRSVAVTRQHVFASFNFDFVNRAAVGNLVVSMPMT